MSSLWYFMSRLLITWLNLVGKKIAHLYESRKVYLYANYVSFCFTLRVLSAPWVHFHWPYQRAVKLRVFLMGIWQENTSHFKLHRDHNLTNDITRRCRDDSLVGLTKICQTSGKKTGMCWRGVKWSQNLVTTTRQKHKKMWLEHEFVVQINSACFVRRKRNASVLVKPGGRGGGNGGWGRCRTLGFWEGFTLRPRTLVKSPCFVWCISLSST